MRYLLWCCELFPHNKIEVDASKGCLGASYEVWFFIFASGFAGGFCRCNVDSADGASGTTWNWDPK